MLYSIRRLPRHAFAAVLMGGFFIVQAQARDAADQRQSTLSDRAAVSPLRLEGRRRGPPSRLGAATYLKASYYGGGERLSRYTASGERFNPGEMTIALRSRAFGHLYRVTLGNRSVIVRHNDFGPAKSTGRSADLSKSAAQAIGLDRVGVATVRIKAID